jgi:hypothetical protein
LSCEFTEDNNKQSNIFYLIILIKMSYQTYQGQTINQFIPNYVVKSDFLPTRVVEGNEGQTA